VGDGPAVLVGVKVLVGVCVIVGVFVGNGRQVPVAPKFT